MFLHVVQRCYYMLPKLLQYNVHVVTCYNSTHVVVTLLPCCQELLHAVQCYYVICYYMHVQCVVSCYIVLVNFVQQQC